MATVIAPSGKSGEIPDDQLEKALAAGYRRAVPMVSSHTGRLGYIPEDRVDEARKAGLVPHLRAPIPTELQGSPTSEPAEANPDEGGIERYLRQSGIAGVWNLLTKNSDIPKSGPERRAAQNAKLKSIVQPGIDIVDALRQGRFGDAGNKAGETVGNMIPGVSQAGDVIKDIANEEYGNIAPDVLGGLTQILPVLHGKQIEGAVNSIKAGATARRASAAEKAFIENTQPAVTSIAPKNKIKYLQDLRKAIPLMQEQDPNIKVDLLSNDHTAPKGIGPKPPTKDTFIPTNDKAIQKVDEQFNPMITRANTYGVRGYGRNIIDAVKDSIPEKYRAMNPEGYKNLVDTYEHAYGDPKGFTPQQMVDRRAVTNAQLSKFYEGLSGQINDTLASNAHMDTLEAEATALRKEIYSKIDPEHNGDWAAELMDRRGALQNVRDQHEALVNKTIGAARPNLVQKVAGTVAGATRGPKAMALEAATRPASVESNIEKAFRQKMEPLAPPPKISPYPQPRLQLGPGTPQIPAPGYNVSDLTEPATKVTTGAPLQVVEPAAPLTPTEPGEFYKQRSVEENPVGQGILFHDLPTAEQADLRAIPSRTFRPEESLKSNSKYTWYEEPEQREPLQMQRPPAEQLDWQKLLLPEQPEGVPPGRMKGPIPGVFGPAEQEVGQGIKPTSLWELPK